MSSFRQYGGLNRAPTNNIVRNHYSNSDNPTISNYLGQWNSKIVSESHIDLSGNSLLNVHAIYFDNGFNIIDGSFNGDVTINGNLEVYKNTQLDGSLNVFGDVSLNSTLEVRGTATFDGSMVVYGDVSLNSTLEVRGTATFDGQIIAYADVSLNSTLEVGGTATFDASVIVYGDVSLNSTLEVGGVATFDASMVVYGDVSLNSTLEVGGDATFDASMVVYGDVSLNSTLEVGGIATFDASMVVYGDVSFNSTLEVGGVATFDASMVVYGDVSLNSTNAPTSAGIIDTTDSSNKIPTTAWVKSVIPPSYWLFSNNTLSPDTATYNITMVEGPKFQISSDYRIKEEIVSLDNTFTVDKLNPVSYTIKTSGKQDTGFIAHEVQEVYPHLVAGEKDGEETQSLNYIGLISILTKEIQELKKRVSELENNKK